jgi:hypothetical protein
MIYVGGSFTDANTVVGRDYVCYYDPINDTWNTWGAVNDFDGEVNDLLEGPDGTIYAGGAFQNCHADPDADYLAQWNGTAWAAVRAGGSGTVEALAMNSSGRLYFAGSFTLWDGDGDQDYIAYYTGTAYAALGTPDSGTITAVYDLAINSEDDLYIGGDFLNWDGDANMDYVCYWDASAAAYAAMGSGLNGIVYALAIDEADTVFIGGAFTDAGGDTSADRICIWNKQTYVPMETGATETCYAIAVERTGCIYASGEWTRTEGLNYHIAYWNGNIWLPLDVWTHGENSTFCRAITIARRAPVVQENYDLYRGGDNPGTLAIAETDAITNNGTAQAYPVFRVEHNQAGDCYLQSIRNETTGKQVRFDYLMQEGEVLTFDTKHNTSTSSWRGHIPFSLFTGSSLSDLYLQPGTNNLTALIHLSTGTSIDLFSATYRAPYWSLD